MGAHENHRYVNSALVLETVKALPRHTPVMTETVGIKMSQRPLGAWVRLDDVVTALERVADDYGAKL